MVDESITQLLLDASVGKQEAVDALFPIVYTGAFLRPIFVGSVPATLFRAQRLCMKRTFA
jgi:hypothetical protein